MNIYERQLLSNYDPTMQKNYAFLLNPWKQSGTGKTGFVTSKSQKDHSFPLKQKNPIQLKMKFFTNIICVGLAYFELSLKFNFRVSLAC